VTVVGWLLSWSLQHSHAVYICCFSLFGLPSICPSAKRAEKTSQIIKRWQVTNESKVSLPRAFVSFETINRSSLRWRFELKLLPLMIAQFAQWRENCLWIVLGNRSSSRAAATGRWYSSFFFLLLFYCMPLWLLLKVKVMKEING